MLSEDGSNFIQDSSAPPQKYSEPVRCGFDTQWDGNLLDRIIAAMSTSTSCTPAAIVAAFQAESLYIATPGETGDVAIATAQAAMQGQPGAIILLDKTYTIQNPIVLATGQAIVGIGNGAILQYIGNTASPAVTVGGGGAIKNVKILGSTTSAGIGIQPESLTSHFTFTDVTVQGFKYGASLNNCYTQVWRGCRFDGNDVGIHFLGQWVMDGYFTEGHIAGNRIGVLIEGAAHLGHEFRTCIEGNTDGGISVQGGLGNAEIHRCYFEHNGRYDIYLNDSYCKQVEIHSNLFVTGVPPELQTLIGIRIEASHYASVHDNFFSLNGPLEILAGANDAQIGPNLFGVKALLSVVSGGANTRFFEGSAVAPVGWFAIPD